MLFHPDATHKWWKEAVVYQIYPASFLHGGSGNLPGWGDIRGIIEKLDYLKDLGVDVIWPSPMYQSPQADMGYDISDYQSMDLRYGTMDDMDELIRELKKRDMKLMMDLVANHTSDEHAWFKDSKSSKTSKCRDWYIWRPAKYDKDGKRQPPNNWAMLLATDKSAWTWDDATQEYFLTLFTPQQPDLNWENPAVREAIHAILRFWLDKGVGGFRMDVINLISKVPGLPDAPADARGDHFKVGDKYFANGPRLHEYLQEINQKVLSKYDTITVGEMPFVEDEKEILDIVGAHRGELNMIFIFALIDMIHAPKVGRFSFGEWTVADLRRIVSKWQTFMIDNNGWNANFLENHDTPRSVSMLANDSDKYCALGAKLLATMNTTLGGTTYIYQGEEIGSRNFSADWDVSEYKDVQSNSYLNDIMTKYPKDELKLARAKYILARKARDHGRTPVQWTSAAPNAGFCSADIKPWMRVNDDYKTVNVEAQLAFQSRDELSVLQHWTRALRTRKEHEDVFVYGGFELLDDVHKQVFAYKRTSVNAAFVVVLNFSSEEARWDVPVSAGLTDFVSGNYEAGRPALDAGAETLRLRPWEAVVATAAVGQ